jgi:predicted aspartyl protease
VSERGKFKPFATAKLTVKNNRTGFGWKSPRDMRIFVDSGASITILPPEAVPILKQKAGAFESMTARVQTMNGVKDATAIKDATLCLDAACFRGNVLISDGINGDVLIGSDFLTKAGCKLDFKKKTMVCGGKKIRFQMEE